MPTLLCGWAWRRERLKRIVLPKMETKSIKEKNVKQITQKYSHKYYENVAVTKSLERFFYASSSQQP